jgi:hypothetical protein
MEKILLVPLTAYKVGDLELWDIRRVAVEYGVSKTKVIAWEKLSDFPKPYAVAEGGKVFYDSNKVKSWTETSDELAKTLDKKKRRVGRPSQNSALVRANKL